MSNFLTAALAATILSLATSTARAEEPDDGWDCEAGLDFRLGSPTIGWTVVCDNVVWLCPPGADDDDNVVQSECVEAVPSTPADIAAAAPSVSSPVERPAPTTAPLPVSSPVERPPTPLPVSAPAQPPALVYPVGGLTAPELLDPPLRAYTYKPAGCETSCVEVRVDSGTVWVVTGPEGVVPVVDRFGRINTVLVDLDGDGRLSPVEMAGTPATVHGNTVFYLKKDPAVPMRMVFQKLEPDSSRLGYWRKAASGLRSRGVIPGQDRLDTLH